MVCGNEAKFGDVLLYESFRTREHGVATPCIYVRQQNKDIAVVLFQHATTVAKVRNERLTYPPMYDGEIDLILF